MQWLNVSTSNLVHSLGGHLGPSQNYTNDKSRPRSRHSTFSTKLGILFNIFEMAEVVMNVPNKRYYIEKTANINVKSKSTFRRSHTSIY